MRHLAILFALSGCASSWCHQATQVSVAGIEWCFYQEKIDVLELAGAVTAVEKGMQEYYPHVKDFAGALDERLVKVQVTDHHIMAECDEPSIVLSRHLCDSENAGVNQAHAMVVRQRSKNETLCGTAIVHELLHSAVYIYRPAERIYGHDIPFVFGPAPSAEAFAVEWFNENYCGE